MSKIFVFASLIAISVAAVVPVKAQASEQNQVTSASVAISYPLSPRELVSLARHGRFKAQGIPGHNNFRYGIRTGKITAQKLISGAIANNRLPAEALNDRKYLKTVADHLKSGGCGS